MKKYTIIDSIISMKDKSTMWCIHLSILPAKALSTWENGHAMKNLHSLETDCKVGQILYLGPWLSSRISGYVRGCPNLYFFLNSRRTFFN